ncbi:hypothetical protein A1O1_05002 [Capronia coronata CBS 617.96]|uniref:Ribonuclease H2 subunit B n=1 Tax=Capronia coronata CBS 617.96 TaxID=1182541 RepID=W9Z0M1_9EURO|nr:uncharacterized protein A1O1_05002 [Capronia coronata CBS 617.96]EXJ88074.1 hypothetical protein A1O1_05002 [Capronia coronata CBS 617.96]
MAIATRSGVNSPVKNHSKDTSTAESNTQREPLRHFILPRDISDSSRFLLLSHPRDSTVERFLFCPERGLFQFTKVHTPSIDPRSLLFSPAGCDGPDSAKTLDDNNRAEQPVSRGYISKSAGFFVATPFDLAFILLPLVMPAKAPSGKMLFQPIDDIFEQHIQGDKHLRYIYTHGRSMIEEAMSSFCDTLEAGDEQMYRPNEEKTLRMIMQKVDKTMQKGLPGSLEEKFVTRALETPVMSVKREDTIMSTVSITPTNSGLATPDGESPSESFDSQSTAASSAPSTILSEVSTASSVSTVIPEAVPQALRDLKKRKTVLDFILASYLPASLADRLRKRVLEKDSPVNFTPLEEHLSSLAEMRAQALASRSIGDFSRKRGPDDEEISDLRAEKKRKQEEEDKKKNLGESRGVRDLKKVNVTGMKKMSDFFAKKPVAKAKG